MNPAVYLASLKKHKASQKLKPMPKNFLLSSLLEITGTGNIYFIPFLTDATFCLIYSANDEFPRSKHQTYEKGK